MTTRPTYSQELHDLLKDLHTAASPAPWSIEQHPTDQMYKDPVAASICDATTPIIYQLGCSCCDDGLLTKNPHNFKILTEARNALPALLAEIERLQERERILAARLARVNDIAPVTYQLALSAGSGVGA